MDEMVPITNNSLYFIGCCPNLFMSILNKTHSNPSRDAKEFLTPTHEEFWSVISETRSGSTVIVSWLEQLPWLHHNPLSDISTPLPPLTIMKAATSQQSWLWGKVRGDFSFLQLYSFS